MYNAGPSSQRRLLVAVDASKHQQLVSSKALAWTVGSFARSGDIVRLLGVLSKNPQATPKLGNKGRVDAHPDEVSAANEDEFATLKRSCEESQIDVSFAIVRGFPAKNVIVQDAKNFQPVWIIMDRFMKKEVDYIYEQLKCGLMLMDKHGKGADVVKLVTQDETDYDVHSCDLFEIDASLSFPKSVDNKNNPSDDPAETNLQRADAEELQKPPGPDLATTVSPLQSCSAVPISVQPTRQQSEILELLGETTDLETKLFHSYVYVEEALIRQGGKLSKAVSEVNDDDDSNGKTVVKKASRELDCYFDENHGTVGWSGNQAAGAPLCLLCANKSPRFGTQPKTFTFSEIEQATDKFSRNNFMAEGGFGFVYKGVLPDGQLVAVKQHKLASRQGDREFEAEVEVLNSAQHRNVVTLIGYCREGGRRILVYEYVCNGSLNLHLSKKNPKPLDWPSRLNIALGAARGLRYLHEECRIGCIVHRDVRPNNILVTHDFTALVADFGLARWQASGDKAEQTRVIGTIGYVAPEYAETGQITEKADVYSFGLVLLEIITGRPAFDSYQQPGQQHLPDWATPLLAARAAYELLDERIDESTVDEYELINMVTAASLCIQKDPSQRPKMSQVVRHLEGDDRESTPLSPISIHNANVEVPASKSVPPRTSAQFYRPKLEKFLVPTRKSISYNEML